MFFRRRYKHFRRLRTIANTFAKHGFGYLFDSLGLKELLPLSRRFESKENTHRLSRGERIRMVFEELGTTFIKLGQVLSTRSDLLPKDVIFELEKLQDHRPPVSFSEIEAVVSYELGGSVDELFLSFNKESLASASIGQVHAAKLSTGEEVVVKVQRPEVRQVVETDLEILFDLARLADRRTAWGERYSLTDIVEEFTRVIYAEMDYRVEGRSADKFKENFSTDNRVYIPNVYWDQTTGKVLTMERVRGVKLSNIEQLKNERYSLSLLAQNLSEIMLKQVLFDGFFHGDPHPGNIFVLKEEKLCFVDFGIVGYLSSERKNQLASLILALANHKTEILLRNILDMGIVPPDINRQELNVELDKLREKYYNKPVREIRFGDALNDVLDLTFEYRIRMPQEFMLLSKAIVVTEGVVRELDPDISLMEVVEPFAKTLIRRQFSLGNMKRFFRDNAVEYSYLVAEMPRLIRGLREKVEDSEFRAVIRHEGFERGMRKLDHIVNRLAFSIVLLSFSTLMAGLAISSAIGGAAETVLIRFPVFEIGFIVGSLMFIWLILSIIRSGRF